VLGVKCYWLIGNNGSLCFCEKKMHAKAQRREENLKKNDL